MGGKLSRAVYLAPPPRITERIDNPQILLHHLLQEYLVERDINIFSINLRCSLQRFSWVTYWQGVGGKLSRAVYLAPPPRISERIDNPQILLHHLLQKYLVERDINIISIKLRCSLQTFRVVMYWKGLGGKLSRAVYLAPPPRISERMDNQQFLLHHLLQKYLVERDINIISINLRCSLQRFSWVMYWQGVGGKLSRAVYLAPHLEFQRELIIPKIYYTICYRNICWKRYKHYFSQSEMLTSNVHLGYVLTRGLGQAVQGGLSCPPPRISERMDNPQILLHHLLQEYLL